MKIVGFLQNQWFRNPRRVEEIIESKPEAIREEFRQRFAARALFAGCLTGRRLQESLGPELCSRIFWENASKEVGDVSSAAFQADMTHLAKVLEQQQPDLVIAFGKVAGDALAKIVPARQILFAPHPAARGGSGLQQLRDLKRLIEQREATQDFA